MSTVSIPIAAKVRFGNLVYSMGTQTDEPFKTINEAIMNWLDGGENNPVGGWQAVGWAYDVVHNRKKIYATAIQKNPPYPFDDDSGDYCIPDESEYGDSKLVFIVDESEYGNDDMTFAAHSKELLREFMDDMGMSEPEYVLIENDTLQQTI